MAQIKKQYTNPVPILYLYRQYPEISLVSKDINSATDMMLNQQINEVTTLSFKMPYTKDRKISPNDCEKLVKFEGEYYIIKEIKLNDDSTRTLSATCYHESVELKGVYCSYLDLIGVSPEEMFNSIMKATKTPNTMGYKWAGTDVPSNKLRHLQTDNEESVYANLVAMAEVFEGWLEFYTDENEQKWVYLRTKAIKKNKFIKKGIDMKSMGITYDSSEIFTQLEVFGSRDSVTGEELNIMGVNPTGKSYLEDYSYYLAKGIPKSVIDREPKYQQLKVLRDDLYTDANELMTYGKEALKKCSVPQLEATISLSDLSIYVDNPTIPPMVGYELICIDSDIEFNIDCMITGVNRNYSNPADTQVTISNVVRYNTLLQDITHTVEGMDNVLSGDSNGVFIPDCVVKDNNGISITVKLDDIQSNVEIKYNEIMLRVDDFERDVYAEIKLKADSIMQTVEDKEKGLQTQITQNAKEISSKVSNTTYESYVTQTAKEIASKVSSGSGFTSEMKQNSSAFKFLFSDVTADVMTIDDEGILIENSDGSYTRLGSKGIENLSRATSSNGKPYHYLQYTSSSTFNSSGINKYEHDEVDLPDMFDKMDKSNISVSVSVQKVFKDGYYLPYWFGCYGEVTGGKGKTKTLHLYHMSCWRKVTMDKTESWVTDIKGKFSGGIIVRYTIIA